MPLPKLPYERGMFRPVVRTVFGGLNHNPSAGDGEIFDMENLSAREYPLLTPRARRGLTETLEQPGGLGAGERLFWAAGTAFYYDGEPVGTLEAGKKTFALMGDRILIFPDRKYYDASAGVFGSMEAGRSGTASFENGTITGVPAEANTLTVTGADWGTDFRPGDAVSISGCTLHPENNGSFLIREIEGDSLRFSENCFTLDRSWVYQVGPEGLESGQYHFTPEEMTLQFSIPALSEGDSITWDGSTLRYLRGGEPGTAVVTEGSGGAELVFAAVSRDYTETGEVSVAREVPELAHVCVNENRLWGCRGNTIYASKLGDPFNFNVFDGLSTDSWQSGTVDAGDFTACVSYLGYPIFFKEDMVYKVYGNRPDNFQWTPSVRLGVRPGSAGSLAVAGETLFYLSRAGICAYTGGIPSVISGPLGANAAWQDAVAGSDGLRYFVSMTDGTEYSLFAYDTRTGTWHREDGSEALDFAFWDGGLYMLLRSGGLWRLDGTRGTPEAPVAWKAEFGDSTRLYETAKPGSQAKKGLLRLLLRCELEPGSEMTVWVQYDSEGTWRALRTVGAAEKQSFRVPLILRRCDHYRLKLTGIGAAKVYSITEEKFAD